MAQRPSVVVSEATSIPDPADVARVAAFAHEPFVCEGESADDVLAPGTIRRHAFEFARAELDAGGTVPSQKWRRRWSLLLGLDRALHTETPVLADGTTLNPHQIDALSGTYAALLADAQRRTRGAGASDGDALLLSFEDDEPTVHDEPPPQVAPPEDDDPDDEFDADDPDDEPTGDTGEFAAVAAAPDEDDDEDDAGVIRSLEDELEELPDAEPENESALYDDEQQEEGVDEDVDAAVLDDPNAHKRFWFEHATGAGKTVAAMGFVEACRTGGILILTHRRNLVDQFIDELQTRGYGARLSKPLLGDADIDTGDFDPAAGGPVTIETYQWFVRNAGQISGAYTVVICDEAHTALGEKTSATIRAWTGPIFIGMTATGALIARHVTDLFPTQTSRFDLAQAARRGVIAPLRSLRIPPGPGVRTIAKVPLRKGEVDMEFDQDELAKLLDQAPFNLAIADLYKTRFRNTPGVVYTAGVQHAYNVAESFRAMDMKAEAVSGETPKRELAKILADYEAGEIDVLVNAQLLAEGWNSPRATICMHLAPTASKRIYQQRVGRVTRRHPGKEAGVVIDFVHPATGNDDPVVTLHSLLDRDVYRGGAIVVGPVRRGRGRRVKVERRVLPVTPDIERRRQVFERELWRIAVEQLDWGEQRIWAALAGAKASPTNWRRGRAMLNFDRSGELRRQFLITALERNRNQQLRMRAIQEIAVLREAEPFDTAIDFVGQWPREERREASRVLLQAMADRRIGRREQATAWIWRLAEYTRDMHEEYAAQRWPATKHLLGLLVNSSGAAHARNARRLVHAARQHDRRLQAALLAAAVAHTPEAEEVLREARTRLARKPGALSRDLLKDFPSGKRRKKRSRNKKKNGNGGGDQAGNGNGQHGNGQQTNGHAQNGEATPDGDRQPVVVGAEPEFEAATFEGGGQTGGQQGQGGGSRRSRSRRGRSRGRRRGGGGQNGGGQQGQDGGGQQGRGDATQQGQDGGSPAGDDRRQRPDAPAGDRQGAVDGAASAAPAASSDVDEAPVRRRIRGQKAAAAAAEAAAAAAADPAPAGDAGGSPAESERSRPTRRARRAAAAEAAGGDAGTPDAPTADAGPSPDAPKRTRRRASTAATGADTDPGEAAPALRAAKAPAADASADDAPAKKAPVRRSAKAAAADTTSDEAAPAKKAATRRTAKAATAADDAPAKKAPARRTTKATAAAAATDDGPAKKAPARRATKAAAATADTTSDDAAPAKKAATRRTTKAATAADDAPAKKAPARRTTKTTAAATATDDAPAMKAPARRTTKAAGADADGATATKTAATKTAAKPRSTTAAKTTATRKAPAKPRATATKATATKAAATKAAATESAAAKSPAKAAKATATKKAAPKATATRTAAAKAKAGTATAAKASTAKTAAKTPRARATKASTTDGEDAKPAPRRRGPAKKDTDTP